MSNDPYRAATDQAAWVQRSDRVLLAASGRAPEQMLDGMLSGAMPPPLSDPLDPGYPDLRRGRVTYSGLLTPKGRLVTDLRLARVASDEPGPLLLELPRAGVAGATDFFARYLPPRMARVSTLDHQLTVLSVVGPGAADPLLGALSSAGVGSGLSPHGLTDSELDRMDEGDEWVIGRGTAALRVIRAGDLSVPSFDLVASPDFTAAVSAELAKLDVDRVNLDLWSLLRIEKGRPAFGIEMDEDTLPPEAGIEGRSIDGAKGCYTGQEVIVRIRDRGHVNRRLRGLLMGDSPLPPRGAPLFSSADRVAGAGSGAGGKGGPPSPIGEVRSSVHSPRFGQTIGLAYVRREVTPPSTVSVGSPTGRAARVRALNDTGWVLVEGDPSPYP